MNSSLIPDEYLDKIPKLYSTENTENPTVYLKFFHSCNNWEWYVTEYDGEDRLFGVVKGFEVEMGYISLSELVSNGVERDKAFTPRSLNKVLKEVGCEYL